MRLPADDLFDTLSDDEAKKVLAFGRDVLGRRTDKTGAAALLLLRNVNLHDAADAVVKELLRERLEESLRDLLLFVNDEFDGVSAVPEEIEKARALHEALRPRREE